MFSKKDITSGYRFPPASSRISHATCIPENWRAFLQRCKRRTFASTTIAIIHRRSFCRWSCPRPRVNKCVSTARCALDRRLGIIRAILLSTLNRAWRFFLLKLCGVIFLLLCMNGQPLFAQRQPVLKQIDLPHSYYYREMYLPQLTTGPSAAAWSPDSRSLVYSMAGSLWKQEVSSTSAEQLTAGPGYDYQPDWSSDGRWMAYAKYDHDAVELWALNLETKQTNQLTHGSAVNVEPRFSPDGKRLAFVSTSYHGHFHIFTGRFENGGLSDVQRLTGQNKSSLPRYYYMQFDHDISPAW